MVPWVENPNLHNTEDQRRKWQSRSGCCLSMWKIGSTLQSSNMAGKFVVVFSIARVFEGNFQHLPTLSPPLAERTSQGEFHFQKTMKR